MRDKLRTAHSLQIRAEGQLDASNIELRYELLLPPLLPQLTTADLLGQH